MSITSALPVGQPLYGATFRQAVKRFFQGYVVFSGRASRGEFWWAMLFAFLVSLIAQAPFWIVWAMFIVRAVAAEEMGGDSVPPDIAGLGVAMLVLLAVVVLFSLAIALPTYAVMWRRLQDANFHGAFALLSLVGFGIVPLVMCALPSNPVGVRFDPAYRAQLAASWYDPYAQQQAHGQPSPYRPEQQ